MGNAEVGKEDSRSRREDIRGMPHLSAAVPLKKIEIIYAHWTSIEIIKIALKGL